MNEFWEKVEHYNSRLIPFALVALLGIIIVELFFHTENEQFNLFLEIVDYFVILIFIIDIIFLGIHSKNARFFFKHYWLDLIAVIPLGLFFGAINRIYNIVLETERILVGQAILHESLETEKMVVKEAKVLIKSTKSLRVLRILLRVLRLATKTHLFKKFDHRRNRKREITRTKENIKKKKSK